MMPIEKMGHEPTNRLQGLNCCMKAMIAGCVVVLFAGIASRYGEMARGDVRQEEGDFQDSWQGAIYGGSYYIAAEVAAAVLHVLGKMYPKGENPSEKEIFLRKFGAYPIALAAGLCLGTLTTKIMSKDLSLDEAHRISGCALPLLALMRPSGRLIAELYKDGPGHLPWAKPLPPVGEEEEFVDLELGRVENTNNIKVEEIIKENEDLNTNRIEVVEIIEENEDLKSTSSEEEINHEVVGSYRSDASFKSCLLDDNT